MAVSLNHHLAGAWMNTYIPHKTVDLITYPGPNLVKGTQLE